MQRNVITCVPENDDFILDGIKLPKSCEEKILGVIIDNELKFDPHIRSMCKKAAHKLGVLNRISSLLDPEKKRLVFKVVNNTCPPIMKTFFDFREKRYSIRKFKKYETAKSKNCRIWSRNSFLSCSSTMVSSSDGFKVSA